MQQLNPKQERFVAEYLVDLDATQAAVRAGYSKHTAYSQGSRLLKDPRVAKAVAAGKAVRAERLEISADRVLQEVARLAYADIGQAFDDDGKLLPIKDIPEDVRRALAGVEVLADDDGLGVTQKVKFWDKRGSIELLMRHLGMLKDKLEVTVDKDFAELLKEARARARRR